MSEIVHSNFIEVVALCVSQGQLFKTNDDDLKDRCQHLDNDQQE